MKTARELAREQLLATGKPAWVEATPEECEAYLKERATWHNGAYEADSLFNEGKISFEEKCRRVRQARILRTKIRKGLI